MRDNTEDELNAINSVTENSIAAERTLWREFAQENINPANLRTFTAILLGLTAELITHNHGVGFLITATTKTGFDIVSFAVNTAVEKS